MVNTTIIKHFFQSRTWLWLGIIVCCFYSVSSNAQLTLVEWNFPNNPDNNIADAGIPANAAKTIITLGGTSVPIYSVAGASTQSAWCTGWNNGIGTKWWEVEFSTVGFINIEFSSKQRSSSIGPRDFRVEYKIGVAGLWTIVPGANITVADNFTTGVLSNITLPVACENQTSVFLRWIMTTNTSVNAGTVGAAGSSRMDDLIVSASSNDHYRTIATGNWTNTAIWESSPNLIVWSPAIMPPNRFSQTITIRNLHTVTVNSTTTMDEVTIDVGGTLDYSSGSITLYDGPGTDLQVNGTFIDGNNTSLSWNVGATWALGVSANYIKTASSNATNWQNNYAGGIASIPLTANWYLRKNSGSNPTLTSIGMFYPNLIVENVSGGNWVTTVGSFFTGNSNYPTIKGNFDVGGISGAGTISFINDNTNATPLRVLGNVTIRSGSEYRNNGTGIEIQGNLTSDGIITYDNNDARRIDFTGTTAQSINGIGNMDIYELRINKSANDITLNRAVTIDNTLNLISGRIFTGLANILICEPAVTVLSVSNLSFIHGPVKRIGLPSFIFPVGKNNQYRPIGMSNAIGVSTIPFWVESFSNGCNSNCNLSSYSGVNGLWTAVNTGANGNIANQFFVSCAENGMPVGTCGAGCGNNQTLHVGSVPCTLCFLCPGGDCGATYNAGPTFLGEDPTTNKRAESPMINTAGKKNIQISFKYIENGDGALDNAALVYSTDGGSSWITYNSLAKTPVCVSGQGQWTQYSVFLPSSCENIANLKIGFSWTNNSDGVGSDPSFAVDDIVLSFINNDFTAEYFPANPQIVYNNVLVGSLNSLSNCEYWTLTQNQGSTSRNVILSWNTSSCNITTLPDLRVARFDGSMWNDYGNSSTTGNTSAGTITSSVTSSAFGPFAIANISVLPVELLSFEGVQEYSKIKLNWKTASEVNNSHFILEHSTDNNIYVTVCTKAGNGTSSIQHEYECYDENAISGINYYKLKQIDLDGKMNEERTIAIRFSSLFGFDYTVISDHSSQHIIIAGQIDIGTTISITDLSGRILVSTTVFSDFEKISIPFQGARGIYFLSITNQNRTKSLRFYY